MQAPSGGDIERIATGITQLMDSKNIRYPSSSSVRLEDAGRRAGRRDLERVGLRSVLKGVQNPICKHRSWKSRREMVSVFVVSGKEQFRSNGTACWQTFTGTKNRAAAAANWVRMPGKAKLRSYLAEHRSEIEAKRAKLIAYKQKDAIRDLNAALRNMGYSGDFVTSLGVRATVSTLLHGLLYDKGFPPNLGVSVN